MDKIKKRSSYNNLDSYDDELEIVLELLERAERVEADLLKEFEGALHDLCKLYKEWFPFYYPHNVLNEEELRKLTLSLNYGTIRTDINDMLDEIKNKEIDGMVNIRL